MAADLADYMILKREIEQLGRDMRSGAPSTPEARAELGMRISKTLDAFEDLIKAETYRALAKDEEPSQQEVSEPNEMPNEILAKRGGLPGVCADCGQDECACFSHLPRPKITIRPDRMIKVSFPVEYTESDKRAWLVGMKMALVKRKGK